MKGTIVKCLEEMIGEQRGQAMWTQILKDVGICLPERRRYAG